MVYEYLKNDNDTYKIKNNSNYKIFINLSKISALNKTTALLQGVRVHSYNGTVKFFL